MANKNTFDDFIRNNPLFTTEEADERQNVRPNLFIEESDDDRPHGNAKEEKPKRRILKKPAKDSNMDNMVVKTRNKLLGKVDLLNSIGADQLRMETLDVNDNEIKQQRDIVNEEIHRKAFTNFIQEPKGTPIIVEKPQISETMKYLMSKLGDQPMDEKEIEINVIYDDKQVTKVLDNTKNLKKQLRLDDCFKTENKKRDISKETPLVRSREDLVRIYQSNIIHKKSLRVADRNALLDRFKKKTYEDMMVDMEARKKIKEEDNKDEDYNADNDDFNINDDEELLDHDEAIEGLYRDEKENTNMEEEFASLVDESENDLEEDDDNNNKDVNLSNIKDNTSQIKEHFENNNISLNEEISSLENATQPINRKLKTIREKKAEQKTLRRQRRAEKEVEFAKIKDKLKKNFFEDEAEEGSENEEHDHIAKKIDMNDVAEHESGLDVSDEELIDRDEIEFDEQNELDAHKKFIRDLLDDEKRELQKVMNGNFFKRAEDEYNQLIEDENEKKDKLKRMEEMLKFLENNEKDLLNLNAIEDKPKDDNYGIELDNEEKTKINKQYTYDNYKRDMKYLLRKYGHKIKSTKKSFFDTSDKFQMNMQTNKQLNKPQFFSNSLLDMKKNKMEGTFQTGYLMQR